MRCMEYVWCRGSVPCMGLRACRGSGAPRRRWGGVLAPGCVSRGCGC